MQIKKENLNNNKSTNNNSINYIKWVSLAFVLAYGVLFMVTRSAERDQIEEAIPPPPPVNDVASVNTVRSSSLSSSNAKAIEEKEEKNVVIPPTPPPKRKRHKKVDTSTPLSSEQHESIRSFISEQSQSICNVHHLTFDNLRMLGPVPTMGYKVFKRDTELAFGPFLGMIHEHDTVKELEELLGRSEGIFEMGKREKELGRDIVMTAIGHPLERFLLGYHMIESSLRIGWYGSTIEDYDLKWWNKSCILDQGSPQSGAYKCTSVAPKSDAVTKLERFHAFLDDVSEKGFFDPAIMPLTYIMAESYLAKNNMFYFKMESIPNLVGKISAIVDDDFTDEDYKHLANMDHQHSHRKKAWTVDWDEFEKYATHDDKKVASLAKDAIKRMCKLYEDNDGKCFHAMYDIPWCD